MTYDVIPRPARVGRIADAAARVGFYAVFAGLGLFFACMVAGIFTTAPVLMVGFSVGAVVMAVGFAVLGAVTVFLID